MVTGVPPRRLRHKASPPARHWWWLGVVPVLAAAVLWGISPHARLSMSSRGLARITLYGVAVHVAGAQLQWGQGHTLLVQDRRGALWPGGSVAPGQVVTLTVHLAGIAGWPTTIRQVLTTPPTPHLAATTLDIPLGHPADVPWTAPVSAVSVVSAGPSTTLSVPAALVPLGPRQTVPGQTGTWTLRVQARPWEKPVVAGTLRWRTVPWLHVRLTATANPTDATPLLTLEWSAPLAHPDFREWRLSPSLPGQWRQVSGTVYTFATTAPLPPDTRVSVSVRGGPEGPHAEDGSFLARSPDLTWTTPPGLSVRLQEWLAQLGYLPVTWTPASAPSPTWASVYDPPAGSFSWAYPNVPVPLQRLWDPGNWNVMVQGAMMHFEHHMNLPQTIGPTRAVWVALRAAVRDDDAVNTGYSYAYVSETEPEQLWLWKDGSVLVHTLANTGIPATPTSLGTYPVYQKLPFQIMRGTNPNGAPYADPVHWINYFWGSEAVHGFVRAAYGFPQSLGCVELPLDVAETVYNNLPYGSLVTVAPPRSGAI